MRLCKKCAAVTAFVLLFCALIPLTVLGHSGRTDSRGGHYDHQMECIIIITVSLRTGIQMAFVRLIPTMRKT